ncbi:uncharacterized protein LOC143195552 [Rhynchophorus ferrugineus]|uniref:uncharacterized protein LOC143195552 n=1 Tax=Rhynchophorus ferrugineus TaxID=354439 RepID=UPI003FCD829A
MLTSMCFILFLVVLNIDLSIQEKCSPKEELVCNEKVCGDPKSGICNCRCAFGYYRDQATNQCIEKNCKHFGGPGPVIFCPQPNEIFVCEESVSSYCLEFGNICPCQCEKGFFRDPASKTCVKQCPE